MFKTLIFRHSQWINVPIVRCKQAVVSREKQINFIGVDMFTSVQQQEKQQGGREEEDGLGGERLVVIDGQYRTHCLELLIGCSSISNILIQRCIIAHIKNAIGAARM